MDADFAVAYELQVEEVLAASLRDGAVASPNSARASHGSVSASFVNYEQELFDKYMVDDEAEAEVERLRLDLRRQIRDRAIACEISNVPKEWRENGYGSGSSSSSSKGLGFRVYVKGLVEGMMGGVGVAICDGNDFLLFELAKGLIGNNEVRQANAEIAELKALVEGLDAALMLDMDRVTIITDNRLLYQYVSGQKRLVQANVGALSNQFYLLRRKLGYPLASLVASDDIKFAVELARKAIATQVSHSAGCSSSKKPTASCTICMEDTYLDQMFLISRCQHSYCFSCMLKHVQFKLLQGILPKCPHENCKTKLKLEKCKSFLSPQLFEIMSQRVKENSIPESEKIYCPYPRCSALLSKTELEGLVGNSSKGSGRRKCPRCSGKFCLNCKVPWHSSMDCSGFKRQNPYSSVEDHKLKKLATKNLWRQCPKCNHMVSLSSGCYHISCRCGHEFCYVCGAEWKNAKATCKCRLWDERNLYNERHRRHERLL